MRIIRLGQGKVQIFCTYIKENDENYFAIVFREQNTSKEIGLYRNMSEKQYEIQENDVIVRIDNRKSMQVLFDIVEIAAIEFKIKSVMNDIAAWFKRNKYRIG